ncbi:trypsin-like serine peptidase [Streptomyces sp. NPDC091376]|uniref:trypsin-like serine peptidase n=1 Tax=Streptomyces sp. NPDC091376 TaxID=3365994 RepID=UPI003817DCB8
MSTARAEVITPPDSVAHKVGYLAVDFNHDRGDASIGRHDRCSATVVARDVIVTAAHCVQDERGHQVADDAVFFAPGWSSERENPPFDAHWRSSEVLVHPKYSPDSDSDWAHTAYDVAYIVLEPRGDQSIGDVAGWVPMSPGAEDDSIRIMGYPKYAPEVEEAEEDEADSYYRPETCEETLAGVLRNESDPEGGILQARNVCSNLGGGASGGPIFIESANEWRLVGVNHGTYSTNGVNGTAGAALDATSLELFEQAMDIGDEG